MPGENDSGPRSQAEAFDIVAEARRVLYGEPRPSPEWGEPEPPDSAFSWTIHAACGCGIELSGGGLQDRHGRPLTMGYHCERHSWPDLVEGERLLRLAQQEEPRV